MDSHLHSAEPWKRSLPDWAEMHRRSTIARGRFPERTPAASRQLECCALQRCFPDEAAARSFHAWRKTLGYSCRFLLEVSGSLIHRLQSATISRRQWTRESTPPQYPLRRAHLVMEMSFDCCFRNRPRANLIARFYLKAPDGLRHKRKLSRFAPSRLPAFPRPFISCVEMLFQHGRAAGFSGRRSGWHW